MQNSDSEVIMAQILTASSSSSDLSLHVDGGTTILPSSDPLKKSPSVEYVPSIATTTTTTTTRVQSGGNNNKNSNINIQSLSRDPTLDIKYNVSGGSSEGGDETVRLDYHADLLYTITRSNMKPITVSSSNALSNFRNGIIPELEQRKEIVVLLDYDGTLTPIVSDPSKALLPERTKEILDRLSRLTTVGIVSGRSLEKVQGFVGVESVFYAGSHGFDIYIDREREYSRSSRSRSQSLSNSFDGSDSDSNEVDNSDRSNSFDEKEREGNGVDVDVKMKGNASTNMNDLPKEEDTYSSNCKTESETETEKKTGTEKTPIIEIKPETKPPSLFRHQVAKDVLPSLQDIKAELEVYLLEGETAIQGSSIEDNKYSVSVHYRNVVSPENVGALYRAVSQIKEKFPMLKLSTGKKVLEIKPDIMWNKGKAMKWVLEALGLLHRDDVCTIYIGDDVTDEDAFEVFAEDKEDIFGLGIVVTDENKVTGAEYSLRNPNEVADFLCLISEYIEGGLDNVSLTDECSTTSQSTVMYLQSESASGDI